MNGKKAKQLRREAGYTGESWKIDESYHPVFSHMEKGNKKYYEVVNPIKLKPGSKTLYKEKKDAYTANV